MMRKRELNKKKIDKVMELTGSIKGSSKIRNIHSIKNKRLITWNEKRDCFLDIWENSTKVTIYHNPMSLFVLLRTSFGNFGIILLGLGNLSFFSEHYTKSDFW